MIFTVPLALSLVAAAMILFGEHGFLTKIIVVLLAGAALALQFVPALSESVHFMVPLFLQLVVCGWWYIAEFVE
jgi:hypothetical protein